MMSPSISRTAAPFVAVMWLWHAAGVVVCDVVIDDVCVAALASAGTSSVLIFMAECQPPEVWRECSGPPAACVGKIEGSDKHSA